MLDIYNIVDKFNKEVIDFENIQIKNNCLCDYELYEGIKQNLLENLRIYSIEVITFCFNDYAKNIGGTISDYWKYMDINHINEICLSFPVLVSKLKIKSSFYVNYVNEIINNLDSVHDEIKFKKINGINFNLGDSHNKGKSTCIITLDNKEYIYKPRESVIEKRFNAYISKFIEGYGYDIWTYSTFSVCEKVAYQPPTDQKSIEKLYYNFGLISGVIYMLNSADNHYENVIIYNEFPYFVDLECVSLHKNIIDTDSYTQKLSRRFFSCLDDSVLGTNIFPLILKPNDMEISALCGKGGTLNNFDYLNKELVFENGRFLNREVSPYITDQLNRVIVDKELVHPLKYVEQIKEGFKSYCLEVMENPQSIISDLQSIYKNQKVRHIIRPTHVYAKYLQTLFSPYYLQDIKMQNELLNNLAANDNNLNTLIKDYEVEALIMDDVPIYYATPYEVDLYLGTKSLKIDKYFRNSLFEEIKNKVYRLNYKSVLRQLNIIEISLLINSYNTDSSIELRTEKVLKNESSFAEEVLLIEKKALNLLISSDNEIQGIFPSLVEDKFVISGLGSSLYEMGGTILMLFIDRNKLKINESLFYNIMKTVRYTKLYGDKKIGGFSGVGSFLYLNVFFYYYTKDKKYLEFIKFSLKHILENYESNLNNLDYMNGISSTVILIINMLDMELQLTSDIEIMADRILKKYIENIKHYGQEFVENSGAGVAHGLSGLAYAIYKISNYYTIHDFDKLIRKTIELEDELYLEYPINNYIDPRNSEEAGLFFCYGLPGILQTRMRLVQGGMTSIKEETQIKLLYLVDSILENKINLSDMNYNVCHGMMSVLEVIVDGYRRSYIDKEKYEKVSKILLDMILSSNKSDIGYSREFFLFGMGLGSKVYAYNRHKNLSLPSIMMMELI